MYSTLFGRLGPFRRHDLRRGHHSSPLLVQQDNMLIHSRNLTFVLIHTDNYGHTSEFYL